MVTSSASEPALILRITLPLWAFTVISLIPSWAPISAPVRSYRSRGTSLTGGMRCLEDPADQHREWLQFEVRQSDRLRHGMHGRHDSVRLIGKSLRRQIESNMLLLT